MANSTAKSVLYSDSSLLVAAEPQATSEIIKAEHAVAESKTIAVEAATRIRVRYGAHLDRRKLVEISKAFRAALVPRRKAGRKRNGAITAAHADWKTGIRGLALHRKHIRNFDKLSRWRRESQCGRLSSGAVAPA